MTEKQRKVLDYMIAWAEREMNDYDRAKRIEALATEGILGMDNFGDAFFYGLQNAGYSYRYVNDAASGGERGGYSGKVLDAIEEPFKEHFKNIK